MSDTATANFELVSKEPDQVELAVQAAKLDPTTAQGILDAYTPFASKIKQLAVKAQSFLAGVTPETQDADGKVARQLRLAIKEERVGAEKTRKKLGEDALRMTKAINGVKAVIDLMSEPLEAQLLEIENAAEIAEEKRKAELVAKRTELLKPYPTIDPKFMDLAGMPEDHFNQLVAGAKAAKDAADAAAAKAEQERQAAAKAAEEARLAKARADAEEKERQRVEAEKLKAEQEARERELQAKLEAERVEREKAEAAAAAERKKAEEAAAAAEKKAREEREAIEAKAKAERKARAEREAIEAQAAKERAERERLENAERERVAAEQKRQEDEAEAARKAAAAPDSAKLVAFADLVETLELPKVATGDGMDAVARLDIHLKTFKAAIRREARLLAQ